MQSDYSIRCPHDNTLQSGYQKCVMGRFLSDCANAQVDLNLRWAHMSEGTFSYVAECVSEKLIERYTVNGN